MLEAGKGRVKSSVISLHALADGNRLVSSALNSHVSFVCVLPEPCFSLHSFAAGCVGHEDGEAAVAV